MFIGPSLTLFVGCVCVGWKVLKLDWWAFSFFIISSLPLRHDDIWRFIDSVVLISVDFLLLLYPEGLMGQYSVRSHAHGELAPHDMCIRSAYFITSYRVRAPSGFIFLNLELW